MPSANETSLSRLTDAIQNSLSVPHQDYRDHVQKLFGTRYQARYAKDCQVRDAYALGTIEDGDGVPYAGIINPDNPASGPYGGTSLVWFPTSEAGSLIGFGIGTRGLSPDEGILTRPGHRRRIAALRRFLSRLGVEAWSKPDPAALGIEVPRSARDRFPGFEHVFRRYGKEMYCNALVPKDEDLAYKVVQAFFDLYAFERGWHPLKDAEHQYNQFHSLLRDDLFPTVTPESVYELLKARRFVVLQGPPGTGKTRLAEQVRERFFSGHGMTVQFHPAVTYEDFVVGLSPNPDNSGLKFDVRPGWLLQASVAAQERPFLLTVDEVNRADLGKVLGEAIYLFEPDEINSENKRSVILPHAIDGKRSFRYPKNLYVLATMNTADRSISNIDLAIRRRFAFVSMLPDRVAVNKQALKLATDTFDRITNVFIEHVSEEGFDLMPGHAYFLAGDESLLKTRFRYELLPLLDEYLRQGLLGAASAELFAVRDSIADQLDSSAEQ